MLCRALPAPCHAVAIEQTRSPAALRRTLPRGHPGATGSSGSFSANELLTSGQRSNEVNSTGSIGVPLHKHRAAGLSSRLTNRSHVNLIDCLNKTGAAVTVLIHVHLWKMDITGRALL
ncbi:hypothetical protein AOLI_G00083600 [Acnodon oligacanthus]